MSYAPSNLTRDNVYLNVRINHDPSTGDQVSVASYDVNKTRPIINKCDDYYCSVLEATVPLDTIPIWIADIVPNQDPYDPSYNPNLMTSKVAINIPGGFGGYYPTNLIFTPETSQTPPVQDRKVMVTTSYYFSYAYSGYINSFNDALASSFVDAGLTGPVPYIFLDSSKQLLCLIVSQAFLNVPGISIQLNNAALNYLQGFQYFYDQNNPNTPIRLILEDIGNICNENGAEQGIAGGIYRYFYQQYYSLESFNALRKIIITTNSIPIYNEFIQVSSTGGQPQDTSVSFPVLLDFTPTIQTGSETRTVAYYRPVGQYRMVDLIAGTPLNKINIKVYWADNIGVYYPLYIQLFQTIDIKIGFFKKALYNNAISIQ